MPASPSLNPANHERPQPWRSWTGPSMRLLPMASWPPDYARHSLRPPARFPSSPFRRASVRFWWEDVRTTEPIDRLPALDEEGRVGSLGPWIDFADQHRRQERSRKRDEQNRDDCRAIAPAMFGPRMAIVHEPSRRDRQFVRANRESIKLTCHCSNKSAVHRMTRRTALFLTIPELRPMSVADIGSPDSTRTAPGG